MISIHLTVHLWREGLLYSPLVESCPVFTHTGLCDVRLVAISMDRTEGVTIFFNLGEGGSWFLSAKGTSKAHVAFCTTYSCRFVVRMPSAWPLHPGEVSR